MGSEDIIRGGLACRPFFNLRRALVAAGLMLGMGFCSLIVRLLCREHPFRIYMQGAMVKHRDTMGVALVPTGRPRFRASLGWSFAAYLVLAESIAYLPGIGLGLAWQPGLLTALGLVDEPFAAPDLLDMRGH